LKRFAAIVTIVVVVLAMSAGTAFASVCVGSTCGRDMTCPVATSPSCPMDNGAAMSHSACDHQVNATAHDALAAQQQVGTQAVATALGVVPAPIALYGASSALPAPDARGAPHLTTVIRI
jgi:hypothetical protein